METGLNERKRKKGLIGYENRVLIIMCLAFGFVFFDRLAVPILFTFMAEEMGLTATHLGTLTAALGVTWSLSAVSLGFFANKIKKMVPFFAILIFGFSLVSFAAGLVTTFVTLLILRAAMGVVEGPVLPIAQSFMSVESSEKRRGFNMGLMQTTSASFIATTIGPVILIAIATASNWRFGFYFTIIPGILIAAASLYFLDQPKKVNLAANMSEEEAEKFTFKDCFKYKNIWLCIVLASCMVTWYILSVTFAPTYFADTVGLDPMIMGFVVGALGIGGMVWGTAIPTISGWAGRKRMVQIACLIAIGSPLLIIYGHGLNYVLLGVLLAIFHMGQGPHPIIFSIIPSETVPQKFIPAAIGLVMGIGEFIGGVIMPVIAGIAADNISPDAPFWIIAGSALLAFFVSFGLKETLPSKVLAKSGGAAVNAPAAAEAIEAAPAAAEEVKKDL